MAKKKLKIKKKDKEISCEQKLKKISKWWLTGLVIFLIIFLFSGLFLFGYQRAFAEKIYAGVKVDGIKLTNKTKKEASDILKKSTDEIYNQGITFQYKNRQALITPIISSPTDPDVFHEILRFNIEDTVEKAYELGHKENVWTNIKESLLALINEKNILLTYELNEEELFNILKENFSDLEKPAQNAKLKIEFEESEGELENVESEEDISEKYTVTVIKENLGNRFDYEKTIQEARKNIENLDNKIIEISLITDYPEIDLEEANKVVSKLNGILNQSPLTLKHGESEWILDKRKLAEFLDFGFINEELTIILKNEFINKLEEIASEINVPAQDAKFEIINGRVTQFQGNQDGIELDVDNNYGVINHQFINESKNKIELTVKTLPSKVATSSTNDMGIEKIIGIGKSNFSGSPKNRRINIAVGADTLNGILIKPDEEFSLITTLGDIDAENGYLPELVIKGNKTIPEYGGGLCQIGTTTFRVALDTGLPVTERRSHSYRVSYYEPAGTDATIYDPRPDLKFVNDTGNYILIQTKIDGDELIFEFWGTPDGREVEVEDPIIYNITSPGPTKIVETEDLEPGKKRCTESSHAGADAKFDRTITYANGEVEEETWTSHYVPWRAVCLLGVEPGTLDKEKNKEMEEGSEENTEETPNEEVTTEQNEPSPEPPVEESEQ